MTVAAPDPRNIIGHVPGRICVNPTDLSLDFPHGGLALGEVEDAEVLLDAPAQILTAEERGNAPYEAIHGGEAWSIALLLREWNAEAYARFFPNSQAGLVSGHAMLESPGSMPAGARLSERQAVWVFSPINLDLHPMVVFYAGIPMLRETARLRLRLGGAAERLTVPVVIVATEDSLDRVVAAGRRSDLGL